MGNPNIDPTRTAPPTAATPAAAGATAPPLVPDVVAALKTIRGDIQEKAVAEIIKTTGFSAETAPLALRQNLADYLRANLERFTPRAQHTLDMFINPVIGAGKDIWDGLQVGFGPGVEPALMQGARGAPPSAFYQINYGRIAASDPTVDDMRQGADGDCWFDSSAAALAQAGLLKTETDGSVSLAGKPFITPRADGQIEVQFHSWNPDGTFTPRTVIIGRALPQFGTNTVYDGAASANRLWAADLEKALATLRGGYDAINGGWEYDALATLTGWKPTVYGTATTDKDDLFQHIEEAVAAHKPITADTFPSGTGHDKAFKATGMPNDGTNETGVVPSHAYTILGTKERTVVGPNGQTSLQRFVMLRNPWGTHEPSQAIGPNDGRDDGTFELPYEMFLGCYEFVHYANPPGTVSGKVMNTPGEAERYIETHAARGVRRLSTPTVWRDTQGRRSPVFAPGATRVGPPLPRSVAGVRPR